MINSDRIVPVTATDLISLYGLILKQDSNNSALVALDATNPGEFEVTSASGSLVLADEPVASLDIASGVSSVKIYFVPAYDYKGFTVNGSAATIAAGSDAVSADGRTLYSATLASGAITIAKVGF